MRGLNLLNMPLNQFLLVCTRTTLSLLDLPPLLSACSTLSLLDNFLTLPLPASPLPTPMPRGRLGVPCCCPPCSTGCEFALTLSVLSGLPFLPALRVFCVLPMLLLPVPLALMLTLPVVLLLHVGGLLFPGWLCADPLDLSPLELESCASEGREKIRQGKV